VFWLDIYFNRIVPLHGQTTSSPSYTVCVGCSCVSESHWVLCVCLAGVSRCTPQSPYLERPHTVWQFWTTEATESRSNMMMGSQLVQRAALPEAKCQLRLGLVSHQMHSLQAVWQQLELVHDLFGSNTRPGPSHAEAAGLLEKLAAVDGTPTTNEHLKTSSAHEERRLESNVSENATEPSTDADVVCGVCDVSCSLQVLGLCAVS